MRYKRGRRPVDASIPEEELRPSTPEPTLLPVPLPVDPIAQMDELLIGYFTARCASFPLSCGLHASRVPEQTGKRRGSACLEDKNLSPSVDIVLSVPTSYFSIERS